MLVYRYNVTFFSLLANQYRRSEGHSGLEQKWMPMVPLRSKGAQGHKLRYRHGLEHKTATEDGAQMIC